MFHKIYVRRKLCVNYFALAGKHTVLSKTL